MLVLSKRFKQAREHKKMTQEQLAELIHVSQQAIQKIEDGKTKIPRKITMLAAKLDVSSEWLLTGSAEYCPKWLITGEGPMREEADWPLAVRRPKPIPIGPTKKVPLIRIRDTETFLRNPDKEGLPMVQTTFDVNLERAFAVEIQNSGSTSTNLPGQRVAIVDPTQQPRNGGYVFVRLAPGEDATVRILQIEGGKMHFQPLNADYKIMTPPEPKIIGRVVGIQTRDID